MPALIPTDHFGTITWLGAMAHRQRPELESVPLDEMVLDFAGYAGDHHAGLTRPSCSRVTSQYPKGTEIRNVRQLSVICAQELAGIASTLGLEALDPALLGASVVISGLPDFSHIPPSSRLQAENGTTLTVDMQNRPCQFPARTIEAVLPGHGKGFKAAAAERRGITAWVERPGRLCLGLRVRLHVPDQRAWQG